MGANYEVRGDVAIVTLDNPPVNGLGLATRQAIAAGHFHGSSYLVSNFTGQPAFANRPILPERLGVWD